MTLREEIIEYKKSPNALRDRYVKYISDTTQPLDERWAVFKEAPNEWKHHLSWSQHFETEKLLPGKEICWYDDFYIERHETIYMVDFIEDRIDDYFFDKEFEEEQIKEIVDAFKAEILKGNLGSFIYDW